MNRLDKILVSQGVGSRHDVQKLIRKKAVAIDGETVTKPDFKLDPEQHEIRVNGQAIAFRKNIYIMMNKPQGVVCATQDNLSKTVLDLVPESLRRRDLAPAGRLDKDTVGLLILTDDGDFAHRIISPKKHVYKRYYAELDGAVTGETVREFESGVTLSDGTACLPARLEIAGENSAYVEICEGKFHQVKRMFSACGLTVKYLRRVSIGGLELDSALAEGECREMTEDEKSALFTS